MTLTGWPVSQWVSLLCYAADDQKSGGEYCNPEYICLPKGECRQTQQDRNQRLDDTWCPLGVYVEEVFGEEQDKQGRANVGIVQTAEEEKGWEQANIQGCVYLSRIRKGKDPGDGVVRVSGSLFQGGDHERDHEEYAD